MLGYTVTPDRGEGDLLLAAVAERLEGEGWRLAGVVQSNIEVAPDRPCLMELRILSREERVPISMDLGPGSSGCRLDADALETAVALAASVMAQTPRLLVVNKFGKHEAEGRGFRTMIGEALAEGVPVITTVSAKNRAAFEAFAGELAEHLPPDAEAILTWCRARQRT